jgi:hypothetical protein
MLITPNKWLALRLWPRIAARFFHLREIERYIEDMNERYLDAVTWAKIRGISIDEAAQQLEEGLKLHYLEECLLYEWPDSPIQFLVPKDYMGRTVRLSDMGYIGENDQLEVVISPNRVRKVFIASEKGAL